jgi:putative ubiquitin-RnfH superfamily antitoxin RatB of RatAB toxin-antitoxin module
MASPRDLIAIEIVCAQPQRAIVKSLKLAQGSLVSDALAQAARNAEFLGVDLVNAPVGIFGKLARREQALKDGDRIEIYRQLLEEPKAARRTRSRA